MASTKKKNHKRMNLIDDKKGYGVLVKQIMFPHNGIHSAVKNVVYVILFMIRDRISISSVPVVFSICKFHMSPNTYLTT